MNFKDNTLQGILRSLAADEFLAWMQYYFAEIIAQGKALNFSNKVFNETGKDELEDHYKKLTTWMQSNAILVPTDFAEMMKICNTPYFAFGDGTDTGTLIQHQITAEQEAIDAYTQAMIEPEIVKYPDLVVMLGEICTDEREHLKELMDVMSSIAKQVPENMNFSVSTDTKWLYDNIKKYIELESEKLTKAQETIDDLTEISQQKWDMVGRINYTLDIEGIMKYIHANKFLEINIDGEGNRSNIVYYYNQINLIILVDDKGIRKYSFAILKLKGEAADPELISVITSVKGGEVVEQKNFSARLDRILECFSKKEPEYCVVYTDEDGQQEYKGSLKECQKFIDASEARIPSGEKFELISGPTPVGE